MVSYLIFKIIIIGILIIGIFYSFASDVIDYFVPLFSTGPLAAYRTSDTIWGFDVVMTLFKFVLIPVLVGLIYFTIQMAQKPEKPWGR